ncbi:YibE/F family protein, partial [Lactobacillus sp. XV13L]|nr:YibE/F family protein [Lactobacillus sp. XV13L]
VGATWLSTFFAVIVSTIILQLSNNQGIHYETLNYGIQPFQWIFLAETLLGVLGACMDETTDITASVYQLLQEQPQITKHQLFTSGMHVGREIIGPLINILFYLFLAELIPIIVLYLRNGNTLQFSLSRTLTLGYTQTVISAIGIVLAVPLTAFLAASLLRSKNL